MRFPCGARQQSSGSPRVAQWLSSIRDPQFIPCDEDCVPSRRVSACVCVFCLIQFCDESGGDDGTAKTSSSSSRREESFHALPYYVAALSETSLKWILSTAKRLMVGRRCWRRATLLSYAHMIHTTGTRLVIYSRVFPYSALLILANNS